MKLESPARRQRSLFTLDGRVRWPWQLLAVVPLFALGDLLVLPVQTLLEAADALPAADEHPVGGTAVAAGSVFVLAAATTVLAMHLGQRYVLGRHPWEVGFALTAGGAGRLLAGGLLGGLVSLAAWNLMILTGLVGTPTVPAHAPGMVAAGVTLTALNFLQTGVLEEGVFRGYLPRVLGAKMPPWAAIAVSTAAFSLLHVFSSVTTNLSTVGAVAYFVSAAVIGLSFTVIFHATNSLWLVIGMHWMFDTVEYCLGTGLDRDDAVLLSTPATDAASVTGPVIAAALTALVAGICYLRRRSAFSAHISRFYQR